MKVKTTREKRIRRHARIRARIHGTAERPRLSVFRSGRHFGAQLIDDTVGRTLVAADDREAAGSAKGKKYRGKNIAVANLIGALIAKKAFEKDIHRAVFDRGGWRYHGAIKALADAARKGGLIV